MEKREAAVASLLESYRAKYNRKSHQGKTAEEGPHNAFYISPAVSFISSHDGISVQATSIISKGTVVIRVPQTERVSLTNYQNTISSPTVKKILRDIQANFHAIEHQLIPEIGCLHDMYRYGDICLAVAMMHELTNADADNIYPQGWPSPKDLRESHYPLWDPNNNVDLQRLLQGTYTLQSLERYAKSLRYTFEEVVLPIITKAGAVHDFVPSMMYDETCDKDSNQNRMETLWEAFRYTSALIRSRSHEGRIPDEPEIIPIVDLINGLPSFCSEKINVDISSSCGEVDGIPTSIIYAVSDIAVGEELIISYGDIRASACLIRYAYCPMEVVNNSEASLDVVLLRVPTFLGPPDKLRSQACGKSDLPTTQEDTDRDFFLHAPDDLSLYISSPVFQGETENIKAMRQFLMLCQLLDDEAVKRYIVTGRLAGDANVEKIGQLLLLTLDHSLRVVTSLDKGSNDEDCLSTKRNDLVAAHRVRICQRDTLARWRHAFCCRYKVLSEHTEPKAIFAEFLSSADLQHRFCPDLPIPRGPQCLSMSRGCHVCGRTIKLKACSKCKIVKYCGRAHQIFDWKKMGHKQSCDPSLATDE